MMKKQKQRKTEFPITFSDQMVKAILDGEKTQTRRLSPSWKKLKRGDKLWVQEAFAVFEQRWVDSAVAIADRSVDARKLVRSEVSGSLVQPEDSFEYKFQHGDVFVEYRENTHFPNDETPKRWRPGRFMPRWASRIELTVEGVRVERIQMIDEDGASLEGFESRAAFFELWNQLHESAGVNPEVVVISFRVSVEPERPGYFPE